MAFKGVEGAGIEPVTLKKLLTSSNQDEIDIGKKQWIKRAKENPDSFRKVLAKADADLKNSPNKSSINYNNLKGFPKEVLDGIVPSTNAPTPKTVDDALKAPSTATNRPTKVTPWGNESRISITPTRAASKPTSTPSSSAPSSSSSSAPYYYVRKKDGTGKVTSKIYEGEDIYKAINPKAFGTTEPASVEYVKKGAKASKPSTTPAARPSYSSKATASSPAPKSVDSVIKPTSTPKPTPKVVTPSTITTPIASTPVTSTAPIPSVSTTPPIATPYNSLSPSVYDTVTPAPAPATRPVDSVIKPTPAPTPAPKPAASTPAPASTSASAPATKTITTPKLFSVPASSTVPSSSLGPLPSTPSASSTPVATPSGSPLSSSVYGKVTPTPASAPASAPTAATAASTTTASTPSSSAPPIPESAPSGVTSGPKPAATAAEPGLFSRAGSFLGNAAKAGLKALPFVGAGYELFENNNLPNAVSVAGSAITPWSLLFYSSDIADDATEQRLFEEWQREQYQKEAPQLVKKLEHQVGGLLKDLPDRKEEPYGEVPFIMASNGVPYFQNENGFTHQPYENPQSLSYTYFGGEQHPMNDPGEITDANRSISMPTRKAAITTASTPAPAPARRRRQTASPMETAIATPSPREQLAAQRAAALNNARLQQQQAAAQYAALNAPKPGFNPSGYATGHEAYYDPYKSQLLFR